MSGKQRRKWQSSLTAAAALCALLPPAAVPAQEQPAPATLASPATGPGSESDFGLWLGRTLPRPPPRPAWIGHPELKDARPVWRSANEAPRQAEAHSGDVAPPPSSDLSADQVPDPSAGPVTAVAVTAEPDAGARSAADQPAGAQAAGAPPAGLPLAEAPAAPPPAMDKASEAAPAAATFLPADPTPPPSAAEADLSPFPLILTNGYSVNTFIADRRALRRGLEEARPGEEAKAALDLAHLMLSHLLMPEARSFLAKARELGLEEQPDQLNRWQAMGLMADILEGRPVDLTLASRLEERSLWMLSALSAKTISGKPVSLQLPSPDMPLPSLAEAVADLQNHSLAVIERLLPGLFSLALVQGDHRIAEGLLRGAREATTLPQQPVYHLMMGRLALAYDMPQDAFDYFARAAQGHDLSAQRARIAMADLALERKDPKLLPALRDILKEGVNQWRHDYEALILRARLARVAEDLGDIPLALDIMGKIRQDHPGTPEAVLAHERGALALAAFAVAVEAGAISLETYLVTMREVEPFYRLDPVWPIARQALAQAFERAGLSVAAASEYSSLQIDLNRIDAPVPPERQMVEIPLKEAEAWLQTYNSERARLALSRFGLPRFRELQGRYNLAALTAGSTTVSALRPVFDTTADLAFYARSARESGALTAAFAAHEQLAAGPGFAGFPGEAIYAALTAHELGAPDLARSHFESLQNSPEGSSFPERQDLFDGLIQPLPPLQPLSRMLSDEMLGRAEAARDATRALLGQPLLPADEIDSPLASAPSDP